LSYLFTFFFIFSLSSNNNRKVYKINQTQFNIKMVFGLEKIVEKATETAKRAVRRVATELAVRNPKLYNEVMPSIVDEQTGLYGKVYFQRLLDSQIKRISKSKDPGCLCYMLLDIDNFHDFNETYGHSIGDKIITLISEILDQNTRSDHNVRDDYVGMMGEYHKRKSKYSSGRVGGGEEFGVILPFTPIEGAKAVAERLRSKVAQSKISTEEFGDLGVTISIGIAEYLPGDTAQDLISKTDNALMKGAKGNGKNRVMVYQNSGTYQSNQCIVPNSVNIKSR